MMAAEQPPQASVRQGLTRVEVISPSGRVLVCQPCEAEAHFQDGGRTLKAFIDREPQYLPARVPFDARDPPTEGRSHGSAGTRTASKATGWMDSEGPVTVAPGRPVEAQGQAALMSDQSPPAPQASVREPLQTLKLMVAEHLANCCSHWSVPECDAAMAWLAALPAPPEPQGWQPPRLEWSHEGGVFVVSLRGVNGWHLSGHGDTEQEALDCLASSITAACALRRGAEGQAPAPQGWQPIETAPLDGTYIIGALADAGGVIWRVHEMAHNGLAFYDRAGGSVPRMTHWMPLPKVTP